ncbi:kynurenine 3-monooxygenase [Trichonephila clavipes]|nr:kynurenine 3-monooxygenase [Trichonephila clavipes]
MAVQYLADWKTPHSLLPHQRLSDMGLKAACSPYAQRLTEKHRIFMCVLKPVEALKSLHYNSMDVESYKQAIGEVLPAFSKCRQKDIEVLCDLSISAHHAMKLHTSQKFVLRNRLDEFLNRIFPKSWLLLNSEINFSKLQYAQCLARKQAQDKVSFIHLCATL